MSKKNYRALLSVMLAVFMLLPSVAGMVQAAPQVNEELLQSAEMVSHENRESGMVGFSGEYALDEDEEQVSVIVELQNQPAALVEAIAEVNGEKLNETTAQLEAKAEADMDALIEALEGIDYEITTEYDTAFNGVAVTVPAYAVEMLANLPNVFTVYPNEVYENVTGAGEAEDFIEGMGDSHEYYSDVPSLGLTGKGVTVGIIDTGVDYKHPDLSDSFGSTRPSGEPLDEADLIDGVFYGRNYIEGNGHDVNDPWDDQGHGTHVAGTVTASNHNEGGISALGMAPDATIISYKVINAADSCSLEDVVAAMEDAVEDGCEIISMSLGWSGINDADHGTTTAMNSLALQNEDVLFVVCAGNSGPNNFKVWSPGTSPLALTVANAQIPSADRQLTITRDGEEKGNKVGLIRSDWADEVIHNEDGTFGLEALKADENGNYKMVLVPTVDGTKLGTGTFDEYKALIGENTADYEGTLFVVERAVSFDQHVKYLHGLGIEKAGVVVINTESRQNDFENISWWQGYFRDIYEEEGYTLDYMPIFTVQYTPGQALIEGLELNTAYNFKFTDAEPLTTSVANGADLFPSSDTSRGPVSEKFYLKPDLSAPGKAIISTYPAWLAGEEGEYDYAYTVMSGTSMATPHVSGFVALMKEAYPDLTALELKSLLVNTADYMAFGDKISRYAVGNGMIDPVAAYEAAKDMVTITSANQYAYNNDDLDTTVETPVISFGGLTKNFMTEDVTETVTVTVKNAGTEAHTYAISLYNPTHAADNDSTNAGDIEGIFSLSAETVTVEAGSTATFDITAAIPADAEVGSYEVTVVLEDNDSVLSIPAALYVWELLPISDRAINTSGTFLHSAVLSSGEYRQLKNYGWHGSDRTMMHFQLRDATVETWYPVLLDREGNLLGIVDGWYSAYQTTYTYYYWDVITTNRFQTAELDENGNLVVTGERTTIPEGFYKLGFYLEKRGVPSKIATVCDLVIDNTLPELTTDWQAYAVGDNAVIKGNIYDEGTAKMEELKINSKANQAVFGKNTSQQDNVVIVRLNGKDYRAEIDKNGDFTVTIPKAEAIGTATVYYGDHFLPQGTENGAAQPGWFATGFNPYDCSYAVQTSGRSIPYMDWYAYRAANMTSFEVEFEHVLEWNHDASGHWYECVIDGCEYAEEPAEHDHIIKGDKVYCDICDRLLGSVREPAVDDEPVEPDHECYIEEFEDVNLDAWYHEVLDKAVELGLLKGTSDETIEPNGDMTRAMLVTVLYRLEGEPEVEGEMPFADCAADTWYSDAVIWAYENEIINGISETEFAPNANVTREQFATILYRYAKADEAEASALEEFEDADEVSAWALEAMQWACAEGIITGNGDNVLPQDDATRAEAAAMLVRYIDLAE